MRRRAALLLVVVTTALMVIIPLPLRRLRLVGPLIANSSLLASVVALVKTVGFLRAPLSTKEVTPIRLINQSLAKGSQFWLCFWALRPTSS